MSLDNVLELRQYTLRRGQRDVLIALFEREFIKPQDALGAHILGTFRDLDDPDRFVWLRGFADMTVRQRALEAFYDGATWQAHRTAANATMIDSGNVLLLRPAAGDLGKAAGSAGGGATGSIYTVHMHYLGDVDVAGFSAYFEAEIMPRLDSLGITPVARFVTEKSANNFPRLPIRERASMYAWMVRWGSAADHRAFSERWAAQEGWRDAAPEGVLPAFMRQPEVLRLSPTARSPLQ